MCLLFDSTKVENGQFIHRGFHQERVNQSRRALFHETGVMDLSSVEIPGSCEAGVFKCRITYGHKIEKVEFIPYIKRLIRNLKLVIADDLKYPFN